MKRGDVREDGKLWGGSGWVSRATYERGVTNENRKRNPIRNGPIYKEQYLFREKMGGPLADVKVAWEKETGKPWMTPGQIMGTPDKRYSKIDLGVVPFLNWPDVKPTAFGTRPGPRPARTLVENPREKMKTREARTLAALVADAGHRVEDVSEKSEQLGYDHRILDAANHTLAVIDTKSSKVLTEFQWQTMVRLHAEGIPYYLALDNGKMLITPETAWQIAARKV